MRALLLQIAGASLIVAGVGVTFGPGYAAMAAGLGVILFGISEES